MSYGVHQPMATEATIDTTALAAAKRKEFTRTMIELAGMLPVLIVICILFAVLTPNFLTQNNIVNVVRQASINIVLAAGMTFVDSDGRDRSGGRIGAGIYRRDRGRRFTDPRLKCVSGSSGAVCRVAGGSADRRYSRLHRPSSFIVTLGTYTAIRGLAYLAAGGTTVINSKIGFAWIGNGYLGPVPWLVVIALFTIAVSAFILHRTILGVHIYAVGGNAQAARLTGIPVPFILIFAYGVSGLLSGLGGVMSASRLYSAQGQLGIGYELDAIAAVILGGTSFVGGIGTVFGTLIGALIIAVLNNGLTLMNVSFYWQLVIKGAVIILAVMLDKLRTRGQAG